MSQLTFVISGEKTHTLIIDEKLILADMCLLGFLMISLLGFYFTPRYS